jgi:hypothetical protein
MRRNHVSQITTQERLSSRTKLLAPDSFDISIKPWTLLRHFYRLVHCSSSRKQTLGCLLNACHPFEEQILKMCEPLSITTGVVSLLTACIKIGIDMKDIYDGAAIVDSAVKGLILEVEGFAQTLQLMDETLQQQNIQEPIHTTGHISSLWKNITKSIEDGNETLSKLEEALKKVAKSMSVLDSTLEYFRLKAATREITMYQRQICFYKDTMHVSSQTMVL